MIDGNYYMDGEEFILCKGHFICDDYDKTRMVRVESLKFSHDMLSHTEHACYVEEACDRRFVPSSKEEFEIVMGMYKACHKAIDELNTLWFMPRWKEKEKNNSR